MGHGDKQHPDRSNKIRAFIAVKIPEDLKIALQKIQEIFKDSGDRIRWVKPSGMHITLKFLGDIEVQNIPDIGREIEQACTGSSHFEIRLAGTGSFPDMKRPRILWAGIQEGAEEIKKIYKDLEPGLSRIGFIQERRPFRPHITLGRIKHIKDRERFKSRIMQNSEIQIGTMTADAVHLIESRLRPDGAVYSSQLVVSLGDKEGRTERPRP
jgi:2'-5' RNA ligase